MNKKILIIEDDVDWQEIFRGGLNFVSVKIIQAFSIEDAKKAFDDNNSDLAIIAVDACVPGKNPNTMNIVKSFRSSFKGPMIAISSRDDFNNMLMSAGCDHKADKHKLVEKIKQIFNF